MFFNLLYRYYFLLMILCGLFLISCSDDEVPVQQELSRTIIAYIAADNDLSADALNNIEDMKHGFKGKDVDFLIFADLKNENPCLLKLSDNQADTILIYPEMNASDPFVLKNILSEIISMYPADELGLILWSHGTSWLPAGSQLRSFGNDNGKQMNILDLAKNLPTKFDFILFDACLMGSIEVAYELKDKTDYIIASSTETIYEGFPYDRVIPELLRPTIDLQSVAQEYFNFYNERTGAYCSATVSVIDTKQLTGLAKAMRKIVTENNISPLFDRQSVQRLDVYSEQYVFDLADFVNKAFSDVNTQSFSNWLNLCITYKNSTPMFLLMYEIRTYCGLSCYIPCPGREDLNAYYKTLQWYKDAGINY